MVRLLIMTIGKTHSGKTTFARKLEQRLSNSVVIDQDNHSGFINTYYRKIVPTSGENTLKHKVTQAIVEHAVKQTDLHLILCNANRGRTERTQILESFRKQGFTAVMVYFDLPDALLMERVRNSTRSKVIFRSAASFEEVLLRQQKQSGDPNLSAPSEHEADHVLTVTDSAELEAVLDRIVDLASQM
ncbi:ATP-binding protein [Saccharibacillus endophyticus]|uniref:CRISPR-associated endoribonuclease Cas2 n=1 Tax=Saccharibacillus endophyticus TaxID=2060666 RepID=A0ABQ1ZXY5_9BACL|nr:ATP-binding protein [Saccharibacillus endophyticus]GGH79862.1 CRISPR-associated endoribonuclease Cas2 [Saccharibacillus endophyticus]